MDRPRTAMGRLVSVIALALAAGMSAGAQTYTFTSCKNAVILTVKFNMIVSDHGPLPDGQGGHDTNVIFFGDFILTAGGSTQTYANVVATGAIYYSAVPASLTTLQLQVASGGPVALQVTLQGAGDLIPDGAFHAALPPLAQWTAPSIGMTHDYIAIGNPTVFELIDSFSNCNGGNGGPGTAKIALVISASAFGGFRTIAPGTWIEIYGSGLSPDTRAWTGADFNGPKAPISLDGVKVLIDGEPAFISYISPGQINAQVPSDVKTGTVQVVVSNNGLNTQPYGVMVNQIEPGLLAPSSFNIGGKQYVVALSSDYATYYLPANALPAINSRPVKPGETIILYGIGFGLVTPPSPAGIIEEVGTNRLILPVEVFFGGTSAQIAYAGLATGFMGLYQFNVVVPLVPDNPLLPITFTVAGHLGTQTLYTAVHQ